MGEKLGTSPGPEAEAFELRARELRAAVETLLDALGKVWIGPREEVLEPLLFAVLSGQHVLLEGLPGLGKTRLVKGLARGLGLGFSRIQCTPDLMPSDVTGTEILEQEDGGSFAFRFRKGPVFGNLVLADEINRATPKTQAALLEAMEEEQVTLGGTTHPLPKPFTLCGTQNPIEMEGTYPLPEAQLDRFALCLTIPYPAGASLREVLEGPRERPLPDPLLDPGAVLELRALSERILVGPQILDYLAALCRATLPEANGEGEVRLGASPRAGLELLAVARMRALCKDRVHVVREDLEVLAASALRHRILLGFEARARGLRVEDLLHGWLEAADRASR